MKPKPILSALVIAVVLSIGAFRQSFAQSASGEPQTPLAVSALT